MSVTPITEWIPWNRWPEKPPYWTGAAQTPINGPVEVEVYYPHHRQEMFIQGFADQIAAEFSNEELTELIDDVLG